MRMPRTARTYNQICSLKRDNIDWKDYWLIIEEKEVTIHKQKVGNPLEQEISIPRGIFERFIDWYNDGQWPRKKAKKVKR